MDEVSECARRGQGVIQGMGSIDLPLLRGEVASAGRQSGGNGRKEEGCVRLLLE